MWCWNNKTYRGKRNEPQPKPHTLHKNELKIDSRLNKCNT